MLAITIKKEQSARLGSRLLILAHIFFFPFFLKCGPFFKVFIEFVTMYCFCFMFWFLDHEACGILAPQSGFEPAPPALEGTISTTRTPGKSSKTGIFFNMFLYPSEKCLIKETSNFISMNYPENMVEDTRHNPVSMRSTCIFLRLCGSQSPHP